MSHGTTARLDFARYIETPGHILYKMTGCGTPVSFFYARGDVARHALIV